MVDGRGLFYAYLADTVGLSLVVNTWYALKVLTA